MELISIIITYYNKKNFIRSTIESVSLQTYNNFEVLIIYDQENFAVPYNLESKNRSSKAPENETNDVPSTKELVYKKMKLGIS